MKTAPNPITVLKNLNRVIMAIVLLAASLTFACENLGFKLLIIPVFLGILALGIMIEAAWRNEEHYQKCHATPFKDAEALIP